MISRLRLFQLLVIGLFAVSGQSAFSQCFQIESILVDACDTGTDEGFNEMVRFKVGAAPINTSNLSVDWPSNAWQGLVQNAATAAKVAVLNTQVAAAGGCAQLLEPVGGVLPANAKVVLITSYNFGVTANIFGAITENVYIIFQDNATTTSGHFGNYNATPGIRTLSMNFGACTDTVSYERSLLININGNTGGTSAQQNGSTVNFTPTGVATYVNTGCFAPLEVFTVDAGVSLVAACPGATISLSGSAVGFTITNWTALSGTFAASGSLATTYTLPANASGTIVLTLTATNACGSTITDTVSVTVSSTLIPTFNPVPAICAGAPLEPLPTTSTNSVTGTWSPALNNTATTTYTFTPAVGQCASTASLTITVNPSVTPAFSPIPGICSGSVLTPLPVTSLNGIIGTWTPALNNTVTTTYTFTPNSGQCAAAVTLTIAVSPSVIPTFAAIAPICSGTNLSALPTTSTNGITGTWSPAVNNTATTTYTFTPSIGQCASTASLTIVVNNSITPVFDAVAGICTGGFLLPLPTTSNNGVTGSWSPAINNTTTTTYTFTPAPGGCATTTSLTINVNSANIIPAFDPVPPICAGGFLAPLPVNSLNGVIGTWSPAMDNSNTTTYTYTPDAGQCAIPTTLEVVVQKLNLQVNGNCSNGNFVLTVSDRDEQLDGDTASFIWRNNNRIVVGDNDEQFDASAYLNSTPVTESLPLVFSVDVTTAAGCTQTRTYLLENIYCDIQKGISPNGDTKNDFFDLALVGVKHLSIFNRYGTAVYSKDNYTNQWHGQSDADDELPDGTYYYVLELTGNSASKTGWIYVNKQAN